MEYHSCCDVCPTEHIASSIEVKYWQRYKQIIKGLAVKSKVSSGPIQ